MQLATSGSTSRALGRASLIHNQFHFMADFPSEEFRTAPNDSATFGNVPHAAESFRSMQNAVARKSDHTLTVREVARMFETAGVARTERSITNWCQPNKTGIARLDAFYDPNERKYFITPGSAEIAIQEEQSKDKTRVTPNVGVHETRAEQVRNSSAASHPATAGELDQLQREVLDLKILNQGKDFYIKKLQEERKDYVAELMRSSHRVGQLETRLGIESPTNASDIRDPSDGEEASLVE